MSPTTSLNTERVTWYHTEYNLPKKRGAPTSEKTLQIWAEFELCKSSKTPYVTVERAKRYGLTINALEKKKRVWKKSHEDRLAETEKANRTPYL